MHTTQLSNNVLAIGSIRPLKNRFWSDVLFFVRWSSPITFILIKIKLSSVSYHTHQKLNKLSNITKLKFTVAYLLPYRIYIFRTIKTILGNLGTFLLLVFIISLTSILYKFSVIFPNHSSFFFAPYIHRLLLYTH